MARTMNGRAIGIALPWWLLWAWLLVKVTFWLAKVGFRFVSGRPLDGVPRSDATFLARGTVGVNVQGVPLPGLRVSRWSLMPGVQRAAWRLGVPVAALVLLTVHAMFPTVTDAAFALLGAWFAVRAARRLRLRWRGRRFRRTYLVPLARVAGPLLGHQPFVRPETWLTVSADLGELTPRLAKPLSEAEIRAREFYTARVEPVLRFVPDLVMLGYWHLYARIEPTRERVMKKLRRPGETLAPRVQMRAAEGVFVNTETKQKVRAAVTEKLGLGDLVESWDQIGPTATGMWVIRKRPPNTVGLEDIADLIDQVKETEFVLGLGADRRPVTVSVDDDSPHIACSAGSGAGKSVLAMLLGVQVLRRGGRVLILDKKGSHRWALGLPGVTYCTEPADMHDALIGASALADDRNRQAMREADGWTPEYRVLIIFEEMNATVSLLKQHWEDIRTNDDPKTSPAIAGFRNIMYTGRSGWVNLFGVAQMLTAQTTGGPEARENFGIRCLARYTANNWKMLAPECAMPRKSKTRGRWQVVVAGDATETQVAFLWPDEARLVAEPRVPVSPWPGFTTVDQDGPNGTPVSDTPDGDSEPAAPMDPYGSPVTLRDAVDAGLLHGKYEAIRKQLQRDRAAGDTVPRAVGKRGRGDTYRVADLIEWGEAKGYGGTVLIDEDRPSRVE